MEKVQRYGASLGDRWLAYVRTRRGAIATVLAVVLAILLIPAFAGDSQGQKSAGGALGAVFVGILLAWILSVVGVAIAARMWEDRTHPATPPYARRQGSSSAGAILRRDNNAGFWRDRGGFMWAERYWFAGTGCPPVEFAKAEFAALADQHGAAAVPVAVVHAGARNWWWWQDAFYWETGDYDAADVKALLFQRERRRQRELEHAHTLMSLEELPGEPRKREPIPEAVQRLVFRRDEGCCQRCGSTELLQFDHIIPFSLGGSNEPENLQLLCSTCNREKGGRL